MVSMRKYLIDQNVFYFIIRVSIMPIKKDKTNLIDGYIAE